ncbi:hypothetical protein O6H91_06G105700 [Diphasiastrum complanatum]|uniref:Uncharacterized protein n=1 Tax=Diphasiastrum complanatum TaxID=34168 RepID=A0ACC2DH50_DIPCM|nr:hypothetical protein O6H91_06G105700 [Diphasiastrum complanatum]
MSNLRDVPTKDQQDNKRCDTVEKRTNQIGTVSYWKLFRYADLLDVTLMVVGTVAAVVNGFVFPAMFLVQAQVIHGFGTLRNDPSKLTKTISKVQSVSALNTSKCDFNTVTNETEF